MNNQLSESQVYELIDSLEGDTVTFDRVRPHNKGEIRKPCTMSKVLLKEFISDAIEDEHQPGGDIEIPLPDLGQILVGHHDGLYWLEKLT